MSLKLYRIKTVLKHLVDSWPNSAIIKGFAPQKKRIGIYFDLLYWFYFYGHDFNDYTTFRFWEKSAEEKKSYISLRRNDQLRFTLSSPKVYDLFLDKIAFNRRFSRYIHRDWIFAGDADEGEIQSFISRHKSTIAKPTRDFGGHGIFKIESCNFNPLNISKLNRRGYLIEQCIVNSGHVQRLAPGSLNTVRIVTLIDKDKKLHILASLLRMGNGKAFTDNYHDGGIACAIDPATGCLTGNAYGMNCTEYSKHPYSGIIFDGYKINGFSDCLKLVERLAFEEPEARYVGWDLAITPDGIDLLEANIPPGEDITQIATRRGIWNEIQQLI